MIVVDASVLATALLDSGGSGALARIALANEPMSHGPALLDLEVASAIRKRLRLGAIDRRAAESAVEDLRVYPVQRHDHRPLLHRIWDLRDNLTAYDAAYVALAEALDATLLTADRRVSGAPGLRCAIRVLTP